MAEEDDIKAGGGGGAEAEKPPMRIAGLSLPVFILALLNFLVMAGGLGAVVYFRLIYKPPIITEQMAMQEVEKENNKVKEAEAELDTRKTLDLPPLIINLRTERGGKNHYASVKVVIECSNEACFQELTDAKPQLLDSVQSTIAKRSYSELIQGYTKFRIRHEITRLANSITTQGDVTNAYFSQFTVQ